MSQAVDPITHFNGIETTRIRVYLMPGELTDGYCFNGGVPIMFLNVDWFEAAVTDGRERLTKYICEKRYYKPHLDYLVIGDHPDFTFRIFAARRPAEVAA